MNQNNSRCPTHLPAGTEEPWFGKSRASMNTNVLIQHVDSGKVKRTTFATPPDDKVFGASRPQDPEGAREGTFFDSLPGCCGIPCVSWQLLTGKPAAAGGSYLRAGKCLTCCPHFAGESWAVEKSALPAARTKTGKLHHSM